MNIEVSLLLSMFTHFISHTTNACATLLTTIFFCYVYIKYYFCAFFCYQLCNFIHPHIFELCTAICDVSSHIPYIHTYIFSICEHILFYSNKRILLLSYEVSVMQVITFYNELCIKLFCTPKQNFVILFLVFRNACAGLSGILKKFVEFLMTLRMHNLRFSVEINVIID